MSLAAPDPAGGAAAALRRAFASRSFAVGLAITLVVAAVALISLVWTPYDVTRLVRRRPDAAAVARASASAPTISGATCCR